MTNNAKKMISIWFWVGLVLTVYGIIITGTGVYYIFEPAAIAGKIGGNTNLWWGVIMLVAGVIFMLLGKFEKNESA